MERLDLSKNRLNGPIPASIGFLVNAQDINLNDNYLSGTLTVDHINEYWRPHHPSRFNSFNVRLNCLNKPTENFYLKLVAQDLYQEFPRFLA